MAVPASIRTSECRQGARWGTRPGAEIPNHRNPSRTCAGDSWGFNKNGATRGMSEMCVYFMGNLLKYVVLNQQMGIYIRGEN